jgi:hypothetical protein
MDAKKVVLEYDFFHYHLSHLVWFGRIKQSHLLATEIDRGHRYEGFGR